MVSGRLIDNIWVHARIAGNLQMIIIFLFGPVDKVLITQD
jgi:hypothetical protein